MGNSESSNSTATAAQSPNGNGLGGQAVGGFGNASSVSSSTTNGLGSSSVSSTPRLSMTQPGAATNSGAGNGSGAPPSNAPLNPGAYRMAGRPSNQRYSVTIPRGVRPGQHFPVLVNGQQMMVKCPEDNKPGDRLIVTAPRAQAQQYVVTVPANVKPGQQFRVMINQQEVMVTCPRNVRPGQRVTFQLPIPDRPQPTAPNHQMFEVVVPDGVRSGQPFALIANGQRVMVTCPPNVKPGQKIRFQLPIQLSQKQLEAIRMSYDKDGWMRCLGTDLKFHWVFNKSELTKADSHKLEFDVDGSAFIRNLVPNADGKTYTFTCIPAADYCLDTSVKGTSVSYAELNSVARMTFQQKVEWLKVQFSALRVPWEEGHIKIRVRRHNLLQDAMEAIETIDAAEMKKIFRFEFIGEPALDAGGVAREFFMLLCEQVCNPDFGLFLYSSANQMCMHMNHNANITNDQFIKFYHMLGRVLGKSLMDSQITPVHFVQPLYKHLMGWPITLRDLEHIDEQIYRQYVGLLDFDDVSFLDLDFVVTEDRLGLTESVDIVPDGSNIQVVNENLPDFLVAQTKYRLFSRIQSGLTAFLSGFYDVVPEPFLSVFDFQELELLLHGLPNIDMNDWIQHTDYTGEFLGQSNHKVVQWFWEIVRDYEHENKARLLQFVTGTSGVPVQGFGYLQGNDGNIRKFTIHGDKNVKVFPRAHTCFNRIDMPIYKTKAEMQKFLTLAISIESTGFDIE